MPVTETKDGRFIWEDEPEAPQAVPVEADDVEQVNDPRPGSRFDGLPPFDPPAHPPPGKLVGVGVSVELTPEEGAGVTRLLKEQGKWPGGAAETGESAAETSLPTERAGELLDAVKGPGDREAAADALVLDRRGLR